MANGEERIESLTRSFVSKYNPKSTADIAQIAREEYGVGFVEKTPLVWMGSRVCVNARGTPILYYASFKPYEPFALAHELGHVALNHEARGVEIGAAEIEADLFASGLCGISPNVAYLYRTIDAVASMPSALSMPFLRNSEKNRLRSLGLQEKILQMI